MLDENEVKKAFRKQLFTVDGLPNKKTRIWYTNRGFNVPEVTAGARKLPLWIKEQLRILSEPKTSTCFVETTGEMLWLVHTPIGRGSEQADDLCLQIARAFRPGSNLIEGDTTVTCVRTERRPFRQDPVLDNWIFKPVVTVWRSFTPIS